MRNNTAMRFLLTKDAVTKLGSCSLQGMILNANGLKRPEMVTIVFQGSSMEYCRRNHGPELVIVPDYVFFCLAESIKEMIETGWNVKLEIEMVD